MSDYLKVLYMGDSTVGKTGSLVSLLPKYKLRVLDLDNGLKVLYEFAKHQNKPLDLIQHRTYRNKYRVSPQGLTIKGSASAFPDTLKALDKWPEDESSPSEWGSDHVLVIDSLSALGRIALEWARIVAVSRDDRAPYRTAQEAVESLISMITSEDFATHVICITHISYTTDQRTEVTRGYPNVTGRALGPTIGRYFPTVIMADIEGSSRSIKTVHTPWVSLRTPAPFKISKKYDISTGMAELFSALQED